MEHNYITTIYIGDNLNEKILIYDEENLQIKKALGNPKASFLINQLLLRILVVCL